MQDHSRTTSSLAAGRTNLHLLAAATLLSLALCACGASEGAGGGPAPGSLHGPLPVSAAVATAFPAPDSLPLRQVSTADLQFFATQYDNSLPTSQHYACDPSSMYFEPYYDAGDPLSHCAYSGFTFHVLNYSGPGEIRCSWLDQPDPQTAWIGLSDYANNRWEWHAMPANGVVSFNFASGHYQNAGSLLRVFVLLTGNTRKALQSIVLGDNSFPIATLGAKQYFCNAGDTVSFDAAGSYDFDGSIVDYQFDPEGDGSYVDKGLSTTITHKYTHSGDYNANVVVKDDQGLLATGYQIVHVGWLDTVQITASGGQSRDVLSLPDGSSYYCGYLDSGGLGQGFIAHVQADGESGAFKTYSGSGFNVVNSIARDSQGNIYAAAGINGTDEFGDLDLLKFDADLNLIWQKQVAGNYFQDSVAIDSQGRVVLSATQANGVGNQSTIYCGQFTKDGAANWQKSVSCDGLVVSGICVDGADNIYLAGYQQGVSTGNLEIGCLISLDQSGAARFSKYVDVQSNGDPLSDCCFDGSAVMLAGSVIDVANTDGLLMSVTPDGSYNWARYLDGAPANSGFQCLAPLPGGGLAAGGYLRAGADQYGLLVELFANGTLKREESIGVAGEVSFIFGLSLGASNEWLLAGYSSGQLGTGKHLSTLLPSSSAELKDIAGVSVGLSSASIAAASGVLDAAPVLVYDAGGASLQQYFSPLLNL